MGKPFIRVRCDLYRDPKVHEIAHDVGAHVTHVAGALTQVWSHANEYGQEGNLRITPQTIDRRTGIPGFVRALCKIGWAEIRDGKVWISKWDEYLKHNGKKAPAKIKVGTPSEFVFPCKDGDWTLPTEFIDELHHAYKLINITQELKKAQLWTSTNTHKRKLMSGMPRFLNSWMQRAESSVVKARNPKGGPTRSLSDIMNSSLGSTTTNSSSQKSKD